MTSEIKRKLFEDIDPKEFELSDNVKQLGKVLKKQNVYKNESVKRFIKTIIRKKPTPIIETTAKNKVEFLI